MSNSRDRILGALRAATTPFADAAPPQHYRPVVPRTRLEQSALTAQFIDEAQKLSCQVHCVEGEAEALEKLLALLKGHGPISCWDAARIPITGLTEALADAGVEVVDPEDPAAVLGLSGSDAVLAATGSLVLTSGPGRYRAPSLLPPMHVAVVRQSQIVPDLESWFAMQREDNFTQLRQSSNVVIISGPSRTADIAMELVMGMHGPRELHVFLLEDEPAS